MDFSDSNKEYIWCTKLDGKTKSNNWEGRNDGIAEQVVLKRACLGAGAKENERNIVQVTSFDHKQQKVEVCICSLRAGLKEDETLSDLTVLPPAIFKLVAGSGPVHLVGNHMVLEDFDDEDDDSDAEVGDEEDVDDVEEEDSEESEVDKVESKKPKLPASQAFQKDAEDEDSEEDSDFSDEEEDEDEGIDDVVEEEKPSKKRKSPEIQNDQPSKKKKVPSKPEEMKKGNKNVHQTPKDPVKTPKKDSAKKPKNDSAKTPKNESAKAPKNESAKTPKKSKKKQADGETPLQPKENKTPLGVRRPPKEYTSLDELRTALRKYPGGKPKKEEKFTNFIKNNFRVTNDEWIKKLWKSHKEDIGL